MCGIAGILVPRDVRARDAAAETGAAAERMLRAPSLNRRGPDHRALRSVVTAHGGEAVLVSTRLAVTDHRNPAANMPFSDEVHGVSVVYNGEIYNHRALRRELASRFRFATRSDTEVLVAAYVAWGDALFERLDGMYAFALVDRRRDRALLAVDHAGQKPLYYHRDARGRLLFASDVDTLLGSGAVPFVIDGDGLAEAVAERYVRDERTHLAGVTKLVNGTAVIVGLAESKAPRTVRHFRLDLDESRAATPAEAVSALGAAIRRANDDVVAGAELAPAMLLSSGVDSASLAALAARSTRPLATYTMAFTDDDGVALPGEARAVSAFVEHLRGRSRAAISHHEVTLAPTDYLDRLERWAEDCPHLVASPDALFQHVLCESLHRDGHRVAVTGCGPDEIFDGYNYGLVLEAAAARGDRSAYAHHRASRLRGIDLTLLFGGADGAIASRIEEKIEAIARQYAGDVSPMQTAQIINWHTRSQYECLKSDVASSAYGIEARKPHYARGVVTAAFGFPAAWKRQDGQGKWLFRRALVTSRVLPKAIANRRKLPFPAPLGINQSARCRARIGEVLRGQSALRDAGVVDMNVVVAHFERALADDVVSEMFFIFARLLDKQRSIAQEAVRDLRDCA